MTRGFFEVFEQHAKANPHRACIKIGERTIAWAEFLQRAVQYGHSISTLRTPRRIALLLNDPLDAIACVCALTRQGIAAVLIPETLRDDSVAAILKSVQPDYLICDHRADSLLKVCSYPEQYLRTPHQLARHHRHKSSPIPKIHSHCERDMTILHSSGTTSDPKGVVHTEAARLICARRLASCYRFGTSSTSLITARLGSGGLQPLLATLLAGGTTVLFTEFNTTKFLDSVRHESNISFNLAPSQFSMLLDDPAFDSSLFTSCEYIQSGGAMLSAKLRDVLYELFPNTFVTGYGSTETDLISRLSRRVPTHKRGSVGIPADDVEVQIVNESLENVGKEEAGEILVCSSGNMRGYIGNLGDSSQPWVQSDREVPYFRTGDIGYVDDDGYIWLLGRRKDVINTAGTKIHPTDIEAKLLTHPHIRDVAVVGVSHRTLGETPVAFVEMHDEFADADSPATICQWINSRLNPNQRLYSVRFTEHLPKGPSGKILKRQLQLEYERSLEQGLP